MTTSGQQDDPFGIRRTSADLNGIDLPTGADIRRTADRRRTRRRVALVTGVVTIALMAGLGAQTLARDTQGGRHDIAEPTVPTAAPSSDLGTGPQDSASPSPRVSRSAPSRPGISGGPTTNPSPGVTTSPTPSATPASPSTVTASGSAPASTSSTPTPGTPTSSAPSDDRRRPPSSTPEPSSDQPTKHATVRPCLGNQLSLGTSVDNAAGSVRVVVTVTNTSGLACAASPSVSAWIEGADGAPVGAGGSGGGLPVNLAAGASATGTVSVVAADSVDPVVCELEKGSGLVIRTSAGSTSVSPGIQGCANPSVSLVSVSGLS